jgi:flagellar biosynthesis chaperone FliJ
MTFIERMQEEYDDLREKLMKLGAFLDKEIDGEQNLLSKHEFGLMSVQAVAMESYMNVLKQRIYLCKKKEN